MQSEFDQFSVLAAMSNSEICLNIKQGTTTRKDFDISSLESAANVFQDHVSSSKDQELDYKKEDIVICTTDDDDQKKRLEQKPSISLGQCSSSDDDDDDGFRTPTSLDHKIPVITHCPTPPRKIIPSRKRKLVSPRILRPRKLLLDLSEEVDSMFPQALQQDIGRKIKKARRDDDALT